MRAQTPHGAQIRLDSCARWVGVSGFRRHILCVLRPCTHALHGAQIRLDNGARVRVNIFIVHEEAREVALAPMQPGGAPCKRFQWTAVVRSQCKKGCQVHPKAWTLLSWLLS